jgi:hypothetical protein
MFSAAREADYGALIREARRLQQSMARRRKRPAEARGPAAAALARLRRRLEEVVAIDFFGAGGRETVEGLLAAVDAGLRPEGDAKAGLPASLAEVRGRTWVTRSGVQVDRIASAWLIRRFIDPEARFEFARGHAYAPESRALRFDMFEADFTHEGDRCTFEVLRQRFGLEQDALRQIAEIVHDIDLKDRKFARPEAEGLDRLLAGIAIRHRDDEGRLRDGEAVFESLYESFKRKR